MFLEWSNVRARVNYVIYDEPGTFGKLSEKSNLEWIPFVFDVAHMGDVYGSFGRIVNVLMRSSNTA